MNCVKCGVDLVEGVDFTVTDDVNCAPCCVECQEDVARETRFHRGMWLNDYYGHWLWALGRWHVQDDTSYRPRNLREVVEFVRIEAAKRHPHNMHGEWFTADELNIAGGYSVSSMRRILSRCVASGLMERRERFRQGYWYQYEYRVKP